MITATQIARWAGTTPAQSDLPRLIRRLTYGAATTTERTESMVGLICDGPGASAGFVRRRKARTPNQTASGRFNSVFHCPGSGPCDSSLSVIVNGNPIYFARANSLMRPQTSVVVRLRLRLRFAHIVA
jgi:hypothetical protein